MAKFTIAQAQARFSELVEKAMLGEEIIITKDKKPVLRLMPLGKSTQPRKAGSGKGQVLYIAPDFDATPEGFKDYV